MTITPPGNVCRVGLRLHSGNTGCIHEMPFFNLTISDPDGIGVWRLIFSGSRSAGLLPGPARFEFSGIIVERANDNETWTILQI